MTTEESDFLMDKEDYVLNSIMRGIAVQYLCNLTGKSLNYWVTRLSKEANEQCNQLTKEQVEQTVQDYLKNKYKNDSVVRLGYDNRTKN